MKEKEANPTKRICMVDGKPPREKTKVAEQECATAVERNARENAKTGITACYHDESRDTSPGSAWLIRNTTRLEEDSSQRTVGRITNEGKDKQEDESISPDQYVARYVL